MLQNPRVVAFTVSGLFRENQQGRVKLFPPPRLGLNSASLDPVKGEQE